MSNNPHHPHHPSGSGNNKATIAIAAVGATASGVAAAVALSKAVAPMTGSGYAKRTEKKLDEAQRLTFQKHEEGPPNKFVIPEERRTPLAQRIQPLQERYAILERKTQSSVGSVMQWRASRVLYQDAQDALAEVKRVSNEEWLSFMMRQDEGVQDHNSGPSGHQQQPETSNYYSGPTSTSHRNEYSSMSRGPPESLEIQEVRRGSSQTHIHSDYYGRPLSSASDSYDSHGRTIGSLHDYPPYPPSMPRDSEERQFSEFSLPRDPSREQAQFSESSQPRTASIRTSHSKTSSGQVSDRPRREIEHDRTSKASSGSGGSEYYSARSSKSTNSNASAHSASQHATSHHSSTANFHQYPANNFQQPGPSSYNNAQNYDAYYTQGQARANYQHSTYSNASHSSSASKKSRSAAVKKQD